MLACWADIFVRSIQESSLLFSRWVWCLCSLEEGGSQSSGGIGGRWGVVSVGVLLVLRWCMSVVGAFSCGLAVIFLDSTFVGGHLPRIGVRESVLGFRCAFRLLCFFLCA